MVRAVAICESPPAVQLSERQIQPALASQVLQGHQLTGRRQQIAAVGQGFVEVTGGVQHVRGDQQIVAMCFEALLQRILLDIQNPVVEEKSVCLETRLGFGKEARGNIRIDVVVPAGRQFGKYGIGGRTGAGAYLNDAQPPVGRQPRHQCANRVGQHRIGRTRDRRLHVQVGRRGLAAAEQQRQRVGGAPQHVRQCAAAAPKQPDFVGTVAVAPGHPAGNVVGVALHRLREGIACPCSDNETVSSLLQQP